jgi:hypothetical protein
MRVQLVADSATTAQIRAVAAAVATQTLHEGLTDVRCNGPEHWSFKTPLMQPQSLFDVIDAIRDLPEPQPDAPKPHVDVETLGRID